MKEEGNKPLGQEYIEFLPISPTPQGANQTAAMLLSSESQKEDEHEQLFEVPCAWQISQFHTSLLWLWI